MKQLKVHSLGGKIPSGDSLAVETESVESDVEMDDIDVVETHKDKMGDPLVKVSEENRDAAQEATIQAMETIFLGLPEEAIEHLISATLLDPTSSIIHPARASVYHKMKKPNAAVLEELLEHPRKNDSLRSQSEEDKANCERRLTGAEAQAVPGGMPSGGFGGMPGVGFGCVPENIGFNNVSNDPGVMAFYQDPFQFFMKALANLENQQANPKFEKANNVRRSVGTINCAIGLGSGVLIGVDSWSTVGTDYCGFPYRKIIDDDFVKMARFNGNVVVTSVGEATRNRKLIRYLERRQKSQCCYGVGDVIYETDYFLKNCKPSTSREEIEVLIVGYDNFERACVLYHTGDGEFLPGGSHFKVMQDTVTKCIGSGAKGAELVLQPRPNMSVEEGIDCMLRGMLGSSFDDDATGGNFLIRLVSKYSSDEVAEVNRIDAMLKLNFPPFKETSLFVFCKRSHHPGVNVGGLMLNFYINSVVLKYNPVFLGAVDDRLGIHQDPWLLFVADLNGAVDKTGFLVPDPCTTFMREKCYAITGHSEDYFCQCDFKALNENRSAMVTVTKMVVMPGTFENLRLARNNRLMQCFDLYDVEADF